MKFFGAIKRRILYKLILGFVSVSLFVGVVSYISLTTIADISRAYNLIAETSMPLIQLVEQMKVACLRLVSSTSEYGFIVAESKNKPDTSSIALENRLMQSACSSCHQAFSAYKALVKNSQIPIDGEVSYLKKKSILLHSAQNDFIEMKKRGIAGEKTLAKKEEMEKGEMEFLGALDSTENRTFILFDSQKFKLEKSITSSFKNILIFTGLTFLISVFIGILYSRSISKPILRLNKATKDFHNGNLAAAIEVDSTDEIGMLGESFNEMAVKMKTLILQLEDELNIIKRDEDEIKIKNAALAKSNSEKDKFFSIIAHDLRSPFHGIVNLTELMADGTSGFTKDELLEHSRNLHATASNLYKLIENLLDWAQIQRGAIVFNPTEFAIEKIIRLSIDTVHQRAVQKEISLENEISDGLKVFADEKMVETVLRNLLSNAVKFTHKGGKVIAKAVMTENHLIEISICDNGIGITNEKLAKLFKVEEKVGSKGTDGELSTGLGLLLCKEFIEKNGGSIWVKSSLEKGSVFTFSLPVANTN